MATKEPRNPFYFLLLAVSMLFVATALAYGIFPVLEENAVTAGQKAPSSAFHAAIRSHGPLWLIYELVAMTIAVVLSLGLDWLRSSKDQPSAPAVPPSQEPPPPA
ncbi:hypothetical protein BH10PLA2_BH10PLA2_35470 [soil metagenome]